MDGETHTSITEKHRQNKWITFIQVLIIVLSIVLSFFIWATKAAQNPHFGIVGIGLFIFYGIQFIASLISAYIYYFGLVKYITPYIATFLAVVLNILAGFFLRWLVP